MGRVGGEHRDQGGFRPLWLALIVAAALGGAGYLFREDISAMFRSEEPPRAAPTPLAGPTAVTPSPVPSPTPTEDPMGRLLIHGTGDVNVDPSYIPALAANGYQHAWTGLQGLLRDDDLSVVNLECAVSELGTAVPKEFNFRCDPAALPAMRRAGVEVANLGNNHAYDYGPEALLDSIANLRENRIAPVGAGRNAAAALSPAVFELNGWTVAVVGIDQVVDPFPEAVAAQGHPGTAAGHDTEAMIRAIREAKQQADLVIVTIHWGVELDTEPRPEQVDLGHAFVDAGADVIFGHHAHRLQPMDHYRGRPIFWGLGNFVWPNFSAAGSDTAVARVVVKPDGTLRGSLLPAHIESPGHPVLTG